MNNVNSKLTLRRRTAWFFFFSICPCCLVVSPFTHSYRPGGDDPRGDTEDEQHGAWADGHECFHDEACVEVDLVEGANAARRSVCEQFAMQQHDTAD